MINLITQAEKFAESASNLPAFRGIQLLHIKNQISELLNLINRDGFFREYTCHDISHVNKMLGTLDWLIPKKTKENMSPADWLMIVLAIYFHDLGMLITRKEYNSRHFSGFTQYRDKELFTGNDGADYRAKVEQLGTEEAEKFLYQEFVRYKHAERIREWIIGNMPKHLGITTEAAEEVSRLLEPLDLQFRRDLAYVCESHHLDDLNDTRKYKVSRPYGDSNEETANLQYAAILLRATDLLHITSDRTPSIMYRIINPTDPLSQQEWAKQRAVRRICSRIGYDRDGNPDEEAPRDTIEVHAFFNEADGFFGLTSYLSYALNQIRRCHEWALYANKSTGTRYEFPWKHIDDTNIEADGFIRETFEFTIDQAKVLDLLTGHTLYNDTSIVIRELVQNAIDAIRLQSYFDKKHNLKANDGKINIKWDSKERILLVIDNGTGMTQDIIERHLLKVGSSRYQDPQFQKEYPEFSPISRFGIGVLSTFMIADNVEIITCHPDEEQARQLSLRSVHGKYLIRLVNKNTDDILKDIIPHGTIIKLKTRKSAVITNIIDITNKWIVIPECEIYLEIDDNKPIRIGFSSPKKALEHALQLEGIGIQNEEIDGAIRIEEQNIDNITLAYTVRFSASFQEWSFYQPKSLNPNSETITQIGSCVEGIRVEFNTPGFDNTSLIALVNAHGKNAPKTNVSRSNLENTIEYEKMIRSIYSMYCNHIKKELQALYTQRSFSLTWATQEAEFLLRPLFDTDNATNRTILIEEIKKLPIILVEHDNKRKNVSPIEIEQNPYFWTIDGALFWSSEQLLRELPGEISLSNLISSLQVSGLDLPEDPIICKNTYSKIGKIIFFNREVDTIRIYENQRRVDLRWANSTNPNRWVSISENILPNISKETFRNILNIFELTGRRSRDGLNLYIGINNINLIGTKDEVAIISYGNTYILPNTDLAKYLLKITYLTEETNNSDLLIALIILSSLTEDICRSATKKINIEEYFDAITQRLAIRTKDIKSLINLDEFDNITKTRFKVFNPNAWSRPTPNT